MNVCSRLILSALVILVSRPGLGASINLGSGDASYEIPLFTLQQEPLSLSFTLYYHSLDPNSPTLTYRPLGPGWTHTFNQTLLPGDPQASTLYHITPQGWDSVYTKSGAVWAATRPADLRGTVTLANNEYTLTDLNGLRTVFDANSANATWGRWKRTVDRWGNTIQGYYQGADLTSIRDSVQRTITLGYTPGASGSPNLLTSIAIQGVVGTWRFDYTNGPLSHVFDPLHTGSTPWRTLTYESNVVAPVIANRLLLQVLQHDNSSATVVQDFWYDAQDRAVECYRSSRGNGYSVEYDTPTTGQVRIHDNVELELTRQKCIPANHCVDFVITNDLPTDYTLLYQGGRWLTTQIAAGCATCRGGGADAVSYSYYADNHVMTKTVGSGAEAVQTYYTYDMNNNGLLATVTEANGNSALQRTTTYTYPSATDGGFLSPWPAFVKQVDEVSVKSGASNHKTTTRSWGVDTDNGQTITETKLTTTVTGFLGPLATDGAATYTTTSRFDPSHHLTETDGPRQGQIQKYTFFPTTGQDSHLWGRRQTSQTTPVSPPAYQTTTFVGYDAFGTTTDFKDPNGVETTRVTDDRGRVTTETQLHVASTLEPDYITTYTFDSMDRLTSMTRPRGNQVHYAYEDFEPSRRTATIRAGSDGTEYERLALYLDMLGHKTDEEAQSCTAPAAPCPANAWSTSRMESFEYDVHGRLSATVHPDSAIYYGYDSRGNQTSVQDERHVTPNITRGYDALNHLITVTQVQTIVSGSPITTTYTYDSRDNLATVTDPKNKVTTSRFDDWSRLHEELSADSGITTSTYDEAGNLVTVTLASTDPHPFTTTRQYDLLNRVKASTSQHAPSPDEVIQYTYDGPNAFFGVGRLTSVTDPAGSSTFTYDRRGFLRNETRTTSLNGTQYTFGPLLYLHDENGNLFQINYPSHRVVVYSFDYADRPLTAKDTNVTPNQMYVSAATYEPFGPEMSITFGTASGTTAIQTRLFDTRYQPSENKLVVNGTSVADYSYLFDGTGNLKWLHDAVNPLYNRDFGYDDLNRLTSAATTSTLWGLGSYTYDDAGNPLSVCLGDTTGTGSTCTIRKSLFAYNGTTSLLSSVTMNGTPNPVTTNVTYDGAGNETHFISDRSYSPRNLTANVGGTNGMNYTYDWRGLRFSTQTSSSQSIYYMYMPNSFHLLATDVEGRGHHGLRALASSGSGSNIADPTDFIWFNDHVVAQQTGSSSTTPGFVFTDHLGTPVVVIDNSGTVVWRAEYEPFGNVFQFRTQVTSQILRLPGQDLMLTENLAEDHYNLFRWYRTEWGRYTQADPLFRSPIGQPYSYAGGNPLVFIDPFGLYHTGDVIYRCDPATHTHCDVVTVLSDPTPDDNNNGDELVIAYGDKFGCKSGQCGDGAHITALRGPDDPYPDYEVLGVCEQLATYGEIADRWADWIINKNDPPWTPLGAGQFSQCYHFVDQLTNQGTTGLELQSNYPFVVVVPHDLTWWKKKCKGKL